MARSPRPARANPRQTTPLSRFAEVDFLRGIAVVLMIAYHAVFDLVFFEGWTLNLDSGPAFIVGRTAAILFVGLAGASMMLSWNRKHKGRAFHFVERGFTLLGLGLVLTLFTMFAFPAYTIWFGVLHLIGLGLIAGTLFLERPFLATLTGGIITVLGVLFSRPEYVTQLPRILPIFPIGISTFDYFPILPWLGVFLLGMGISEWLYPRGKRAHGWIMDHDHGIVKSIQWMGRHSLSIYFIHQPILVGLLLLAH